MREFKSYEYFISNTKFCLCSSFLESEYLCEIKGFSCGCHIVLDGEILHKVSNTVTLHSLDVLLDFNSSAAQNERTLMWSVGSLSI